MRTLPNASLQLLLEDTICSIRRELLFETRFGKCISLDTKQILAWVKENNPKSYIKQGRYGITRQPIGDPDCPLGCKRKHDQRKKNDAVEKLPVGSIFDRVGEYYWGYGSGVVTNKVVEWGEFVLAELTRSFDQSDISYFKPLMEQVACASAHWMPPLMLSMSTNILPMPSRADSRLYHLWNVAGRPAARSVRRD